MTLSESMKITLREWGHPENEINQIEQAAKVTTYKLNGHALSQGDARKKLGTRVWLSGLSRSAFHSTSVRRDQFGNEVFFDSSQLFNK